MAYLGYPPLFFAGPILSFNAFVSQLEKPILSYTAGPSQSEQLVVEREEVVGCRLFFVVDVKSTACFAVGVSFLMFFFMFFLFVVGWGVVPRCCVCLFFWGGE